MKKHIVDGIKQEGKAYRKLMIFGYVFCVIYPLAMLITKNSEFSNNDIIKAVISFFVFGCIGLYGLIYSKKYHIVITEEKITLITLFRTKELPMHEITGYSYKRYRRSTLYIFTLRTQGRSMQLYTRYQEEFREILKMNGIAEAS
jgi:hypothetical protein